MHKITLNEIEDVLQLSLSPVLQREWNKANLLYEELTKDERDDYLREVIDTLLNNLKMVGEHRLPDWENGWNENLQALKVGKDISDLIPKYHSKHNLVRWKQNIIRPLDPRFDYKLHCLLIDAVVEKFLSDVDVIYEFGCGPAYHLLRARKYNPSAKLVGLDWATTSQEIIEQISELGIEKNIEGRNFDFFNPDYSIEVPKNSGFITIAALEQVGDRFEGFLDFVLKKKPIICVHFEPIDELLDPMNLLDYLSILYFRKRGYLSGFLPRLHRLQDEGKIKILREQRTYTGSFFIEGHSLIVWYPL
jgi:hypothetical protein